MKKEVQIHKAAGVVIYKQIGSKTKVLLIYFERADFRFDGWEMPKGHIEGQETIEECALREAKEETGYKNIKLKKFLYQDIFRYTDIEGNKIIKYCDWYLGHLLNNKKDVNLKTLKEQNEIKEIKWFDIESAIDIVIYKGLKKVLKIAKDSIE